MKITTHSSFRLLLLTLFSLCCLRATAQSVYFFRNSNQPGYYDTGLAFKQGASTIEQAGPSGDKIPTETTTPAYEGNNSLRLRWNSKPGGNWDALVIAPGFPFQNITDSDTLSFWAYAPAGLSRKLLPLVYMEGAPGATKSKKYSIEPYTADLAAQTWTQIKIPLALFFSDPAQTNIQFSQIKAIIFAQDTADQVQHTLYIDEVRTYNGSSGGAALAAPANLAAQGYDSHIELSWTPNTEPQTEGYRIYRSADNGASYQLLRFVDKSQRIYVDFVGQQAQGQEFTYKITAINSGGQNSPFSNTSTAQAEPMNDEELLDMVQRYTFRYFWDFAHPVSGMIRERNTSGDVVTTGGTGFGVMALVTGADRGYVTRAEAVTRLLQMTAFLDSADRFHGAFPHWMNGVTGAVIPFSTYDNGGDLVETAFLIQGLLAARQYFDGSDAGEVQLRSNITALWEAVEWNWYRKLVGNVLYWHWSPNYNWQMNFPLRGYNEALIVYVLATASPTHPIPASLYASGWAGGGYVNPGTYYGYPMAIGPFRGGPLFFAHYSFLGFDPRGKKDAYTNYFIHNRRHSLINQAYCIANPESHSGYSAQSWGLTASDDPLVGYLAHEPTAANDNGTLAPTAALSSMPYVQGEAMAALRHFYRDRGARLWGAMGFYDAFNPGLGWYADSYLAIDQGPIICMIENARTGLLWDQFMSNPEIGPALTAVGFVNDTTTVGVSPEALQAAALHVYPEPDAARCQIGVQLPAAGPVRLEVYDLQGRRLATLSENQTLPAGTHTFIWESRAQARGVYVVRLEAGGNILSQKIAL